MLVTLRGVHKLKEQRHFKGGIEREWRQEERGKKGRTADGGREGARGGGRDLQRGGGSACLLKIFSVSLILKTTLSDLSSSSKRKTAWYKHHISLPDFTMGHDHV